MKDKKSVLREVLDLIYTSSNFDEALKILKDHLQDPDVHIFDNERRLIIRKAELCSPSLLKLQQYMTNSFLRYEKMGV